MTSSTPGPAPAAGSPASPPHPTGSTPPRLVLLVLGAALARGRRAVAGWIRAAGLGDRFRLGYTTDAAAGMRVE